MTTILPIGSGYSKRQVTSERLEAARCPVCKAKIILPSPAFRSALVAAGSLVDSDYDPIVVCSDMGHWVGNLSECRLP